MTKRSISILEYAVGTHVADTMDCLPVGESSPIRFLILCRLYMITCHLKRQITSHAKDLAQQDCIYIASRFSRLDDDLTSFALGEKVLPAEEIIKELDPARFLRFGA